MNDALKKLTEKIKSPKILMIAGLCGILLIFLSSLFGKEDDTASRQAQASAGEISAEEYRLQLEEKIGRAHV